MLLRTTFIIIILCYLSSVNAMNPQRFGHCSALAGDTLYVYGGLSYQISKDVHTAGSIMTNFQKFDLKTKVWSTVDKASDQEPRARAFHTCHYNASEIILFGGTEQAGKLQRESLLHSCGLNDVWSFNTDTKIWTELKSHAGNCENSSLRGVSLSIGSILGIISFVCMLMI